MQTAFVKKKPRSHYKRWVLGFFCFVILIGLCIPEKLIIPVEKASERDWNHHTFWYYPWGKSGVHKGVDIFAPQGRNVVAATGGWVIWKGTFGRGGRAVIILGPQWHCHYYAHLQDYYTHWGSWVVQGKTIGSVGTSGNAAGKSPHLHYSVSTLIPYPWRWDSSRQGWKKMFYLNPDTLLR
ncbi:M23 family metallopeptidase [Cytophagaceae bacterium DM2B3-1]|uniref:M23 family metallopeptidase n=1 Tax=Xanthocytophaga flava TaxID=3048013 RepID=A0ABT7CSD0_9BACT|nr:M23 family metallopeptidase [Xanthocytophaga flavus]MDJ1471485.1 M23 family metallopeptidase [Xanthocytophaga flavus]MDJ1496666.1 M23 family metallopeptidase [Xanthocytophaga flavus]